MLLQQIKLNNIRSYIDEIINFSTGSTLLSGDIGCGKSTILLTVEFALFGSSRSELPAESLLRKGAVQGSVEIHFQLENQNIIIQRNLKKDKTSIKQTAGHIIINNVKKELTPVELKAEVIHLLGYPEEYITKNKNLIFRYTVYTPQEEMKLILQENYETRLDALRKIFNIDKYRNVRDNVQIYLKQMRTNIAILKTRLEPFDEQKAQLEKLVFEKKQLGVELTKLEPQVKELQEQLRTKKNNLIFLEDGQKVFLERKQELQQLKIQQQSFEQQIDQILTKQEQIKQDLAQQSVPNEFSVIQTKQEIKLLEEQKQICLSAETKIQTQIDNLQTQIQDAQKNVQEIVAQVSEITEKKSVYEGLREELADKEELLKQQEQLEGLLETTSVTVTKNQTIQSQAKKVQDNIGSMDKCPTCLQEVSDFHKRSIQAEKDHEIRGLETMLQEFVAKKEELVKKKTNLKELLDKLAIKETESVKLKVEIRQLEEKNIELAEKKVQLKSWVQKNNRLMQKLAEQKNERKNEVFDEQLVKKQELINKFSKHELLTKNLEENIEQITVLKTKLLHVQNESQKTVEKLFNRKDLTEEIEILKKEFEQFAVQEKEVSLQQMRLRTNHTNVELQERKSLEILDSLKKQQIELIKLKELYHWIDAHFLKLTYTIEKQVMLNIHHLFNQVFKEWFAILIDDENIYSRLDDTFTPIIEQNGYEISFSNLSGGEKTSAALAYRLALNKVINEVIQQIKTKDLLILDEPTDGFSTEQLDKVRDVLERLNLRQTLIVSHETKIESFVENIVRVNKEDHVSNVIMS